MITFACFHMNIGKEDLGAVPQQWRALVGREDRHSYLDAVFDSCRAQHPGCRTVVLTDFQTPFPAECDYELARCTGLDPARLMFSRSQAWISFLESADSHVVFLDSDILIQASLEPIFTTEFDAGLTYRQEEQWPINAGIQFFHHHRLARGAAFLRACLDVFATRFQEAAAWGGDQDALREITVGADFGRGEPYLWQSQGGFELLLLPCARYNFSSKGEQMPGLYPGIPVLHFKGKRKDDMLPYWEKYLRPGRNAKDALVNGL